MDATLRETIKIFKGIVVLDVIFIAIILAAIKVDYINAFGVIVPMFFPKIIIVGSAINRKV